ncbi:hypothetical protein LJ753_16590 [Arthrobacter sp. zg-Y20]|uniref:hypothetical protein n=1 Tax=unclassified Arthrobacter TaxID=235627 RepID=UPI001D1360DB|nr:MULTISPECIES: hypothetical protein [unclassified Arthrobacter]MCC3277483.1 hypothetical protein [Arthrobacter sp. zg-Y20]MDK1317644.1 hypothetical protein [Arthrobacter sp. zg.Y20]WIB07096.1 hypothetical protein QNO06_05030 [Arthrobacter sp. zg-Y20]
MTNTTDPRVEAAAKAIMDDNPFNDEPDLWDVPSIKAHYVAIASAALKAADEVDRPIASRVLINAVEALHYADEPVAGVLPLVCAEGTCGHPDDGCPEASILFCYECSHMGEHYIQWPCPTIKAIREVAE